MEHSLAHSLTKCLEPPECHQARAGWSAAETWLTAQHMCSQASPQKHLPPEREARHPEHGAAVRAVSSKAREGGRAHTMRRCSEDRRSEVFNRRETCGCLGG